MRKPILIKPILIWIIVLIVLCLISHPAAAAIHNARALAADPITAEAPIAPKLEGLGNHHFPVTTRNPESQRFFDQGLRLTYAFNHSEALRAFKEAARHDPENAMAYWNWALVLGPNLNLPGHYGRALAYLHTDRSAEAQRELRALGEAREAMGTVEHYVGFATAEALMTIAEEIVRGESAYKEGDTLAGLAHLERAVRLEDGLRYNEPPDW